MDDSLRTRVLCVIVLSVQIFHVWATREQMSEHVERARQIASDYMKEKGVADWQAGKMLPEALSPSGNYPATHYLCSMKCLTSEVKRKSPIEFTGTPIGVRRFIKIEVRVPA